MKRAISFTLLILLIILNIVETNRFSLALLFAFVLVMLVACAIDFAIRSKLSARLFINTGGRTDKTAEGILEVRNDSWMPIISLKIKLKIVNLYTGDEKHETFNLSLSAREKKKILFNLASNHCGKVRCSVEKMSLEGIFGIFNVKCDVHAEKAMTMLPEVFDVVISYDLHESDSFDNDSYSPYKKGRDLTETYQIREYEQGDSLKQIHWKLSGKLDKLIVRDPSLPLDKKLMVFVDKSLKGETTSEQKEALAELAVSVCQSLIDSELEFVLVWNEPAENVAWVKDMQFSEDMGDAISQIIGSRLLESDITCANSYTSMYGSSDATHIIYISIGKTSFDKEFTSGKVILIDASDEEYRQNNRELILY
jgi:hypothetical protein